MPEDDLAERLEREADCKTPPSSEWWNGQLEALLREAAQRLRTKPAMPDPPQPREARVTQGPAAPRRHCQHDSTRVDGWLDDHCLRCGSSGYFKDGHYVDPTGKQSKGHPIGKTLIWPNQPATPSEATRDDLAEADTKLLREIAGRYRSEAREHYVHNYRRSPTEEVECPEADAIRRVLDRAALRTPTEQGGDAIQRESDENFGALEAIAEVLRHHGVIPPATDEPFSIGPSESTEQGEARVDPATAEWLKAHPQEAELLRRFTDRMAVELAANDGKGNRPGWLQMTPRDAVAELLYHAAKLSYALRQFLQGDGEADRVREFAADCGNCALMVTDTAALLGPDLPASPTSSSEGESARAQRQDSLSDQVRDLIAVANREGMYDAADFLTRAFSSEGESD